MILKTQKEISQKTSQQLKDKGIEVPASEVSKFSSWLFGKLNKMISEEEHLEVFVPKLGSFKFRRKRGEQMLDEIKNRSAAHLHEDDPEAQRKTIETHTNRVQRLRSLIDRHEKMLEERKDFKHKINELGQNPRDIPEQKQDLGGPEEQNLQT